MMKRRILSTLLAAGMALTLVACGSPDSSQSSAPSQSPDLPPVEDLTGVDTSAIPGVEVRTVFFDPVNSLVSGSMTEQQWIDGIKSASDQMRANLK